MRKIYVIYHSNCYDGFGSAFAAWKNLGDTAEYIPMGYANEWDIDFFEKGSIVFLLDFSAKPEILDELGKNRTVIVLDHHKTVEENLIKYPTIQASRYSEIVSIPLDAGVHVRFNMKKSGAMLSWEFFNHEPVPMLIHYVQDRDLWNFKLHGSREFSAYLRTFEFDFKVWDKILETTHSPASFINTGKACLKQDQMTVDMIVRRACLSNYKGYKIAYCNTSSHWSEVGEALLKKFPDCDLALSFTLLPEYSSLMGSIRSTDERLSASDFADRFGGGGHRNAAGFNLKYIEAITLIQDLHDGHEK